MCEVPLPITNNYEWICPKCGQVNAPWISYCTCANNIQYEWKYTDGTNWVIKTKDGTGIVSYPHEPEGEIGNGKGK